MKRFLGLLLILSLVSLAEAGNYFAPSGGGSGSGTVTSVATTGPITGGTFTTSGTIGIDTFVASGASHARGAVPDPGAVAGTTKFLREDATWQIPSGAPGGSSTQIQYNNSGAFGGFGAYDGTNVTIPNSLIVGSTKGVYRDATKGIIGFNLNKYPEIVTDGASLNNAGSQPVAFTIHEGADTQFSLGFWKDDAPNGALDGVYVYTDPNFFSLSFGNGLGGTPTLLQVTPDVSYLNSTSFAWGKPPTITSGTFTDSFGINLGGTSGNFNFGTNAFVVTAQAKGGLLIVAQGSPAGNSATIIQGQNAAGTALATVGASYDTGTATASQAEMDAGDASGNVHINVQSPTKSVANVGVVIFSSTQAGAGKAPIWQFNTPGDGASGAIGIQAPDSTTGNAFLGFRLPGAFPAANGQPLVATTTGTMSFAAGKTQAYALCTGVACATTCTLTFTGGILTANSGTCP